MKKKINLLLLAGNTLRAKSYAQYLGNFNSNDFEIQGLFYGFNDKVLITPSLNRETKEYFNSQNLFVPELSQSLETTFHNNNWNYKKIEDVDVNSTAILNEISIIESDIVIFAGYGGQLLNSAHFTSGKRYLHMHPGKLPLERGSTTIYYSILNHRKITVTAFYMTKEIDAGENITHNEYSVPNKNVEIDLWIDNIIRADCLINALSMILKDEKHIDFSVESEEYYVIHPVLKHVALLSLK